jgi:predicted ATPase/class 3 adenylate cyclase
VKRVLGFLRELRRRRVVQAAVVYAVVGWITFQVTHAAVPALLLPETVVRVVLLLILIGFPLTLVLAWAYDLTPDGVLRTDDPARWQHVQELLDRTVALSPDQRPAFLRRLTRHDPALLTELQSLLAAHEREGPLDQVLADWVELVKPTELTGSTIGRYRVDEKLGGGGMGVVYSAYDQRLDRQIALKFLSPRLSLREEAKQRFVIEAQAAAALDHPNICTVHEIGETAAGQLYIAMPLYQGETLKQRIGRGPLPVEAAVELTIQAARGLAKAHDRGIVHRDIKPANLIVTADGVLKIVDFGIAKLADDPVTGPEEARGTVAYMSPEQARGDAVGGHSDIWSLGVVLYEMLAGQRPFRGATDPLVLHAIATSPLPPLPDELADRPIGRIVDRMLAKQPAERYAHARDLVRELERYLADRARSQRDAALSGEVEAAAAGGEEQEEEEESLSRAGERRPATVVVANLSGYAGLVERLVPEQLARLSARIRAAAEEIATRYGGVLNEFREDELELLFGVPTAREDHSLRAVRTALELHERVRAMRTERSVSNPDIRLHTGIDVGPIVARPARTAAVRYHVAGDAVHVARRLAAHAAPDEVWISPECHRTVGPFFDTEARPVVPLRERTQALTPRRVVRHTGILSRLDAALRTGLTRYVGRERELGRLEEALHSALNGDGQIVLVTGEAGLGKSRLLHEFRARFANEKVQLLTGRCHSHGSSTAYLPFAEVLRGCLLLADSDNSPAAAHRVAQRALEIAPELAEFVPLYLHLLAIDSAEHPVPKHLHGDQLRVTIQEAIAALLTFSARTKPVVLLLEDWHWADDASEAVLEQLMEVAAGDALLAVVTSRTPLVWRTPYRHHALALEPLEADAAVAMLGSMAGGAQFPYDVAQVLHARAGGNPFFLEEICNALLEDGTLRVGSGVVHLTGPLDALQLPDTVQAVIHTRLERLERESRDVVRVASVIGREFSRGILERALPQAGRLPNALQALKAAGLIQQVHLVPEAVFRFKHILTQEVAYGSLLEHQRKELHGRVAAAIESCQDSRHQEQLQQLAYHHSRAEHWLQAIDYGVRAADRLHVLSEFADALQQLERCEEWLERSDIADPVRLQVDILLRQERLCETLGLRARQQKLIDRLITLLEFSELQADLAEVYLRQGDLFTLLRAFERAEHALNNSLRIWRELNDAAGERNALRSLGLMQWHDARHDAALASIEAALALDRERSDVVGIVGDLVGRGAVLKGKGDLEQARIALEEALELSERELSGDEELPGGIRLPYILHNLANVYREMGDSERALALLRDALATTQRKHLPVQASYHSTAIAHILLQQGKVEDSVATYRAAVASARRARYTPGLSQALNALGEVLLGLGRAAEALPYLEEATGLFTQLRDDPAAARMWSMRATAHERLLDLPTAKQAWLHARRLHHDSGDATSELRALEAAARATRSADPAEAREAYRTVLAHAIAIQDEGAEARTRNSLGIIAWTRGDFDAALDEYRHALDIFERLQDAAGIGLMLNSIGVTLVRQQKLDEAERTLVRAIGVHRTARNALFEAHANTALGEIADARGDATRAREHYRASLELRERAGDLAGSGWTLHRIARLAARAGTAHEARELTARARRIADECGDAELLAACDATLVHH